jgi:hypothetical protein
MKKYLILPTVAAALVVASSASAALIAYEGFSDAAGTALAGQAANSGLSAWTAVSGSASNTEGSLTYSTLDVSGNKVSFGGTAAYYANLSSLITVGANSTYDLWGSFSMTVSGSTGDAGLSIFHGANPTASTAALATFGLVNNGNVRLIGGRSMEANGNVGLGTASNDFPVNVQNFYVFKITINTNAGQVETASLWLNPTLSAGMTEASLGAAAIANVNLTNTGNSGIGAIGLYSTGGNTPIFDEIRLGTSFDSVVSVIPEPSAFAAIAGLAGLVLAATRRRRRA